MGKLRRSSPVAIALILAFLLSSCGVLYKTRIIVRHGKAVSGSNAPALLSATREQLESKLASMYTAIQSFQATVELQTRPSLTNARHGFFLVYINSFNEWHEGHAFEPARNRNGLTPAQLALGLHNPDQGDYRLQTLGALIHRVVDA